MNYKVIIVLLILVPITATAQEIYFEAQPGWKTFDTPLDQQEILEHFDSAVELPLNIAKKGVVAVKAEGDSISTFQVWTAPFGGLPMDAESLESLAYEIEENYRRRTGAYTKVFAVERETVGEFEAVSIAAVYIWKSQNYRIQQYLIPGDERLYSAVYCTKERNYIADNPEIRLMTASLYIDDKPFNFAGFELFLEYLPLVVVGLLLLWGVIKLNQIKQETLNTKPAKSSGNPFLK